MREAGFPSVQSNTVVHNSGDIPPTKPAVWQRVCRVVVPVLSVVGILVGALVCIALPVLGGVFVGVSGIGLACYVGKCIYERRVHKIDQPMNYMWQNPQQTLTSHAGNRDPENIHFQGLTYIKELMAGASGASVHLLADNNGNSKVLKLMEHKKDTLKNFRGNEGRVQEEVACHTKDLLPVVHQHGITKGKNLKSFSGCDLQLDNNKKYSYILSDYVEHESLVDWMSAGRISSEVQFKGMLLDFAKKMKVAFDDLGFVHNDLSRNLIVTANENVRLIDTGLSETKKNPFQGDFKGNPIMNGQAAWSIVRNWVGVDVIYQDPFLTEMSINNGILNYYNQVKDENGEVNLDLFEFNLLLCCFPDIRSRIIPSGDFNRAKLLNWNECISILEGSLSYP